MKNQRTYKVGLKRTNITQAKTTAHFAPKKAKSWLYASSALLILAGSLSPSLNAIAETSTTATSTSTQTATSQSSNTTATSQSSTKTSTQATTSQSSVTTTTQAAATSITTNNKPIISGKTKILQWGDKWSDMDNLDSAYDYEDGYITDKVVMVSNDVNTSVSGIYHVTYSVTDTAGNVTTETFAIKVYAADGSLGPSKPVGQPFTVNFDSMGGSAVASLTGTSDKQVSPRDAQLPTREGYIFTGWYTSKNFDDRSQEITIGDSFNSNTTLYAKWELPVSINIPGDETLQFGKNFNVLSGVSAKDFNGNPVDFMDLPNFGIAVEDNLFMSVRITDDNRVGNQGNFTYTGFLSWSDNTKEHDDPNWLPDQPGTYTVEYVYEKSNDPKLDYYGYGIHNTITVSKKLIVTGTSTPAPTPMPTKYAVSYLVDGGTIIPTQSIEEGSRLDQSKTVTTKEGYIFAGWYTDQDLTKAYDFSQAVTKNLVLYAKWTKNEVATPTPAPIKYAVSYLVDGGTIIPTQSIEEGSRLDQSKAVTTKEGYTFAGWYTDQDLTKAYDFSQAVTKNLVLYAKWTKNEVPKSAAVTPKPETKPSETSKVKKADQKTTKKLPSTGEVESAASTLTAGILALALAAYMSSVRKRVNK